MGTSAFYITDNAAATAANMSDYTKCSSDFFDTGFKVLLPSCTGRYLALIRTGCGMHDCVYNIDGLRAYSGINLLEGAAVIETPTPKDDEFSATNLVENLETRSGV